MEQAACYYCLCLLAALLLPLLLLGKLKKRPHDGDGVRLPPGPGRLPVIGSLHHLLGKPLMHRALADMARRLGGAPLVYLQLGEVRVAVASSPDAAREVMQAHDLTFASRPTSAPTVRIMTADGQGLAFAPYGALWRALRRVSVLELLSARRVRSFHGVREEEAARLVAAVAAAPRRGEAVNVSRRVAAAVADAAVRAMIGGGRFEERDRFLALLEERLRAASVFGLGDLFPSSWLVSFLSGTARRAHAMRRKNLELMDLAIKRHEEKRAAAGDGGVEVEDLVDVLVRIQKEGDLDVPLTMGAIRVLILDLFTAGTETTAITVLWAMSELMRYPSVMAKAQAELRDVLNGKPNVTEEDLSQIKYLKLVIKETLRLHPPVPLLLPRESREACKVLGYDVPKGTTVFVNAWAIGRDPKYWDDAEEFKPERFECGAADFKGTDFAYIPFGAGRRMCPGIAFAQANLELTLAALLYHFDWKLTAGLKPSELDMTEGVGVTAPRKNDLYLHAVARVPPASAQY